MAQQKIIVDMSFQANVSQAKAKMQELQKQLSSLQSITNKDLPMNQLSSGLDQAKNAAAQLSVQLRQAFNQDTGRLDLSRFNQQLKQSGMNLEKYKAALMQAGPAGKQAFGQLAMQIASADTHVIRISNSLKRLGTTFMNTFRYQLSAGAISAVTSTISQAYQYAQDLNESLNDIRIVTGYSADRMADFAKEANKAAKALSSTTTEYTKASLIYFQQGLGDKAVKERTDLTVKMANVTGQSVEQVSEQLTAVWNNFDNGTASLEHYIDVMVALGAATASSSEEISEGLNKFAAVAETVGLSYEYAASALATVTATTRQSADVVGTAFKTLFARIQDLELGKTLDDGTTLGQYSQALEAVGINIKDSNGQLKDMDVILNEMGAKWNSLNKDSQVALAQNVAGVRQYTQLIALMDNWDFFQENLNTANTSTGALQKQSDIYAESWEAARDRVTASLEAIYDILLDDNAFIDILNFFAEFLDSINKVIESVGGLRGVILLLSTALMNMSQKSITTAMSSMGAMAMSLTKSGRKKLLEQRDTAFNEATSLYDESTATGKAQNDQIRNKINLEREYYELTKDATVEQKEILSIRKQNLETQMQQTDEAIKELEAAEKQVSIENLKAGKTRAFKDNKDLRGELDTVGAQVRQASATTQIMNEVGIEQNDVYMANLQRYNEGDVSDKSLEKAGAATSDIISKMKALKFGSQEAATELQEMFGKEGYTALNNYYEKIKALNQEIEKLKAKPIEERDGAEAEAQRQARMREIEKDPSVAKNKNGTVNKNKNREYQKLAQESEKYTKGLKAASKASIDAEKASKDLTESNKAQSESVKQGTDTLEKKVAGDKTAVNLVKSTVAANEELGESQAKTNLELGKGAEAARELNNTFDQSRGPVLMSEKLSTLATQAMSAAMAIQAIQSLGAIWTDEDTTVGEKILQTMMSLGMVIPMVTSAFSAQNAQKMLGIAITEKDNVLTIKSTGGKIANAIATWAQKNATDALNASMLVSRAYFALIATAVVALVAVIGLLVNAFQKQKTAAEKAAEAYEADAAALERMNERLDQAKTKLQEVKDLLDSYDEVSSAFDKLVEGSEAWNENLQKQQEILAQLIEQYPELATNGMLAYVNGIYTIAEGKEDELRQYAQGKATTEMLLAQMGQTNAAAKARASKEELNYQQKLENFEWDRKIGYSTVYGTYGAQVNYDYSYNGKKASSDYLTQNIARDLENAIQDTDKTKEEIQKELNAKYSGEEEFIAHLMGVYDEDLKEYRDIVNEHEQNLEKINKQNEAAWKLTAQSITSNLQGFSQMTDLQQQATTTLVAKQLEKAYADIALDDFRVGFGLEMWEGAYGGGTGDDATSHATRFNQFVDGLETAVYAGEEDKHASGWKKGQDTAWNMEHSYLGQQALAKYTQEVLNKDIATMGSKEFHAERVDIGEDTTIYFADVLQYYADQLANSRLDLQKAFENVKNMPDEMAAAISINYSTLTEEQMKGIATQNADGTWELTQGHLDNVTKELEAQGFSAEEISGYLTEMKENAKQYDAAMSETMRKQADLQKGNALIAQESEKFDLDAETLERYAKSLQKTGKISYEAAAKMAVANAKMSKGVEGLRDKLDDVIGTLKNYDTTSYEFAEAAAEISESLSLMFGADVSNELIKEWADNGSLQKLAAGGKEAVDTFERLRLEVGKKFILSLNIDEGYKIQFQRLLDDLNKMAQEKGVGATFDLDNHDAIKSLNEMLEAGTITVEQVQQMFDSIGWSPEIKWDEETVYSNTVTATKDFGNKSDDAYKALGTDGPLSGEGVSYQVIQTASKIKKPIIGDVDKNGKVQATYTGTPGISSLSRKPSGSGSKSKKKDKNQEIERYHEITQKLEDLNREYDKLGKLKDRAFGQSHLDYLDLESKKLDEVIEGEREYIRQIEEKLALDKEALAKYGVSFDESGRITNYDEVYAAQIDQYNTNPEAYEESYSKFTEEMSQYEDSLNLLEDKEEKLFDKQNERFDKSLEKAEYVVEYGTSLVEDSLSIIEYQLEKIEDKAYSAAEALALMGQKMNEVSKKSDIYKEGIEATLAASGLSIDDVLGASPEELAELVANGTFTAEQVEQLRNYRDELLNTNQEMKDMADETLDKLLEGFDEWNEAIDKSKEKIEHLKEVTSSYRDIIDLIGKDNLGVSNQMLEQMNEFNIAASQSQVDITRRQLEENKRSLEEAREEYRNAASEEEKYYWGQVVESLEETVMQGESDLLSATQDSLNTIQEAFSDALTNITEEFEKAISGMYSSFEALQAAYDQRADERERYLEDYTKIYELSRLTRDINKSMDESDSIRGKQRLLEIQDEINALQESGVEMTQFEVDELRARYELRLAEIALEEAQNAKSQVRMTRDSEGNWSYTYTADQDAIDSAQQNYEDKLYAYQNLTTEYIYDLESQILAIPEELSAALQAIWEDTALTDEEKEARAQEAIDFYTQKDAFLKEQMEKAIGRSKELYDKDWKNYSNATGYKISADEEWIKSFDGTVLSQITGFKTLEEYQQAFAGSAMTMANDMRTAYQTMTSNIDKTLQNMGTSMTTFAQDLQGLMNTNKQKIEEYTKEVDDDIEKMGTSSAEAMKKAADNWALYADYVANSVGANEDLATALNNVIAAIGNITAPLDTLKEKYQEVERQAKAAAAAIASVGGSGGGGDPILPPPSESQNDKVVNERSGAVFYANYTNLINNDLTASKPLVYDKWSDLSIGRMDAVSGIVGYEIKNGTKTLGWVTGIDLQEMKQKNSSLATSMAASKFTKGNMVIATDNLAVYGGPMTKGAEAFFKAGAQLTGGKKEINNSTYLEAKTVGGAGIGASQQIYLDPRYIKIGLMSQYDTGGYTGSWDSSGRLAMLHQKELVLNADDTKNFLAAVNIVRELSAAIDLKALAYQNALGQMSGAIRMSHEPQRLQQDVTIHAEFPNVTERNEIEAAFNSLMNQATQYVYRK